MLMLSRLHLLVVVVVDLALVLAAAAVVVESLVVIVVVVVVFAFDAVLALVLSHEECTQDRIVDSVGRTPMRMMIMMIPLRRACHERT